MPSLSKSSMTLTSRADLRMGVLRNEALLSAHVPRKRREGQDVLGRKNGAEQDGGDCFDLHEARRSKQSR